MSSGHHEVDDCLEVSEDPSVDFCNLSVRLNRPSDHFRRPSDYNPYAPPPRNRHLSPQQIASRFVRDPVSTTLSSFSRVANFVWTPHEEYDSVLELINSRTEADAEKKDEADEESYHRPPPPALPIIQSSSPQVRLSPLTSETFDSELSSATSSEILTRVFKGGLADNSLRRQIWPLILELTDDWRTCDWDKLDMLYDHYHKQWQAILPDQERRFTAFRERKSIVERDVVRCDRSHPFYSDTNENLDTLRRLLMTYVMYDFDTGYVQGMTDLASPILYVWDGDEKKAFWTFVKIMELFKKNFEMSQKTISFQLQMLWKLIKLTDPCFAQYLASNESDNCYFAFRWIICLFKREFMKAKTDGYQDCLIVWETVWSAYALQNLQSHNNSESEVAPSTVDASDASHDETPDETKTNGQNSDASYSKVENEGNGTPEMPEGSSERLTDIQLFIQCLCLSIIRRERDLIMAHQFDACDILKHFNTLQLNEDLNSILLHASTIWCWVKNDGGEDLLYADVPSEAKSGENAADDFDLLSDDFQVINHMNV